LYANVEVFQTTNQRPVDSRGALSCAMRDDSISLLVPEATWLLTSLDLFTRESESSRPDFRPTRATVMVAFGPQSLACEPESAGAGGGIAVTLCPQRDMKTPGQLPGRAFSLT